MVLTAKEAFLATLKANNVDAIKLEKESDIIEYVEIAMQYYAEQFIDMAKNDALIIWDSENPSRTLLEKYILDVKKHII